MDKLTIGPILLSISTGNFQRLGVSPKCWESNNYLQNGQERIWGTMKELKGQRTEGLALEVVLLEAI